MEIVNASAEQVAAMKQRLRTRQEERRAMADIDAFVRVVNSRHRPEVVGVIVPLEDARDYSEFQKARKMRGSWQETAMMAAASFVLIAVSIVLVSDSLREEGRKVGEDIDMIAVMNPSYESVLKSVTVDVVARTLMTATDQEPMTQFSQSAGPYSISGTFLTPGGGLFIKRSELARLGLRKQKMGVLDIYGTASGNSGNSV